MTWPFTISDEQAMWRVQNADDHAAFARLVERWETPVQRLCARMTGDLHRAEDLAQEAFARVFAKRHAYEPTGKISTWLWRIALNLCRDELRRRQRRPELALDDSEHGEGGSAELAGETPSPDEAVPGRGRRRAGTGRGRPARAARAARTLSHRRRAAAL